MKMSKMRARVEQAIADHNGRYPGKIRIVWGHASKEEEEFTKELPGIYEVAEALLNSFDNTDLTLSLHHSGDPDYPDYCTIYQKLEQSAELPRTSARALYNVLEACKDSVRLCLVPDDDDEDTDPDIFIVGVETTLPVEAITARTLLDAVYRVSMSAAIVQGRLSGEDDYDQWAVDGGA